MSATPLFVRGALEAIGLGADLTMALTIGLVAWYLYRGKGVAGKAVGAIGWVSTVSMAVLGVFAVGVALGWIDVNISQMVGDTVAGVETVLRTAAEVSFDSIREVFR